MATKRHVCTVCGNTAYWDVVIDIFSILFERVDRWGYDALTEKQQVAVEGNVCSIECFHKLP